MKRKPCGRAIVKGGLSVPCQYERASGKQRCAWHWLMAQPADVQQAASSRRLKRAEMRRDESGVEFRARVPVDEWPEGERWCAGCQSFVPLFYCSGSRCKACASSAAHAGHIERSYGITGEEYDALLRAQGYRCFICQRRPGKKRLAVDHDHKTGAVRGLLCANNENGCNRGVIANLEAAADGGLQAAKRAVSYLEDPPFARMQRGEQVVVDFQPVVGIPEPPAPLLGPQIDDACKRTRAPDPQTVRGSSASWGSEAQP